MTVINETGRKFVEISGELKEVVITTADTVNAMPGLVDGGVYLCGSGDTGKGGKGKACVTRRTVVA